MAKLGQENHTGLLFLLFAFEFRIQCMYVFLSMVGYGTNKGIVPIACDEIFKRIDEVRGGSDAEKYQFQVKQS